MKKAIEEETGRLRWPDRPAAQGCGRRYPAFRPTASPCDSADPFGAALGQLSVITLESIDYLEREIALGVQATPIGSVRENWPFGLMCVVDCRVRGLGKRVAVVVPVRTAWLVSSPSAAPRLTSAYIKP